jgi:hypothetical protein
MSLWFFKFKTKTVEIRERQDRKASAARSA